jgi:hypothetical protein
VYWNAGVPTAISSYGGNAASATKLASARTISLSTGAVGTATSFDGSANITIPVTSIKESYLSWGGKDFSYDYGPVDSAFEPSLSANRFAGVSGSDVAVDYSRDGGSTWIDYGATDLQKANLFTTLDNTGFVVGKNTTKGAATSQYQLRVTLSSAHIYTRIQKIIIYISRAGSTGCTVTIEGQKYNTDSWDTIKSATAISGWPGYNVINNVSFVMKSNGTEYYSKIRFIFKVGGIEYSDYVGLTIFSIKGYGGQGWVTPTEFARTGYIYSYDGNLNVTFPSKVTAPSF